MDGSRRDKKGPRARLWGVERVAGTHQPTDAHVYAKKGVDINSYDS
jgi:hypothetical protein